MRKISKLAAIAKKQRRYFTGKPCGKGHVAERNVVTGACVECHRANMRASVARARARIRAALK